MWLSTDKHDFKCDRLIKMNDEPITEEILDTAHNTSFMFPRKRI